MSSCTIIISHYESLPFLHACVRQIVKHTDFRSTPYHIIIADQSSRETYDKIEKYYNGFKVNGRYIGITPHWMLPFWSGYGIDVTMRSPTGIGTDYICQLHADAYPISDNWLSLPIKLIEENNFSFVGQLQFISKPTDTIYPPSKGFFAMAQCFNVAKTETYKEMSLEAGFTRFHNRKELAMTFKNNDWAEWAADDYEHKGSDDDVVAFHWQDKYKSENKLGLAITGYIEPSYGRLIEDIVFHFGSCREASGNLGAMPELYQYYTKKINEDYSDELISEMVALAKKNRPPEMQILTRNHWDGKLKKSNPPSEQLNKRIEELKNGLE